RQAADALGERMRSAQLRVVGDKLYDGHTYLGDLGEWNRAAGQLIQGDTPEDQQKRLDRYAAQLLMAHYYGIVAPKLLDEELASSDRHAGGGGLADVEK